MTKEEVEALVGVGDRVKLTTNRRYGNEIVAIFVCIRNDRAPHTPDNKPWWRLHLILQQATGAVKHSCCPLDDLKHIEVLARAEE